MAGIYKKLLGTIETVFQIGLGGPKLKNNSGVVENRNADDNGYVIVRGAAPVGDNDLVTKSYADSLDKPRVVSRQADCSSALPNNTAVAGYVVVSTAGSGAAIGDLLYDDGSSSGTMDIISASEGRTIAVTDSLSGGTATFDADSIYIWDEDGSSWVKVGDIGNVTGGVRVVRYVIDNTAAQDSTTSIPANARVLRASVEITTPYSAGATISVGNTSTADLIIATTDNDALTANTYQVDQNTDWGSSATVVRTTVAGTPAAGAGVVTVEFSVPLS